MPSMFDGTVTLISPSSDSIQRLLVLRKPQISLNAGWPLTPLAGFITATSQRNFSCFRARMVLLAPLYSPRK